MELNSLLAAYQFEFRKLRSVEDQLLLTYGKATQLVNSGCMMAVVFLDFSMAFDVVSLSIVLTKLQMFGIGGKLLVWITEFLIGRFMQVRVGGEASSHR